MASTSDAPLPTVPVLPYPNFGYGSTGTVGSGASLVEAIFFHEHQCYGDGREYGFSFDATSGTAGGLLGNPYEYAKPGLKYGSDKRNLVRYGVLVHNLPAVGRFKRLPIRCPDPRHGV